LKVTFFGNGARTGLAIGQQKYTYVKLGHSAKRALGTVLDDRGTAAFFS